MSDYTILEQGAEPDGRTWARFIYGPDRKEGLIKVAPGYHLEDTLKKRVAERLRRREEWAKLSPDEQERIKREWDETMASFDEKDGGGTSYAMAHSTASSSLA